ncbi:tail fiber domain-containing protein [Chitinophagaceae bacterium MMS25-I14]
MKKTLILFTAMLLACFIGKAQVDFGTNVGSSWQWYDGSSWQPVGTGLTSYGTSWIHVGADPIWSTRPGTLQTVTFKYDFTVPADYCGRCVRIDSLYIQADDTATVYINGVQVATQGGWSNMVAVQLPSNLIRCDTTNEIKVVAADLLGWNYFMACRLRVGAAVPPVYTSAVAINTCDTCEKLVVKGGAVIDDGGMNAGAFTQGSVLRFGACGSGEGIASNRNAGANPKGLDLYTGSANRMSVTSGGFVGIGTTAPETQLHVKGDIRIPKFNKIYLGDNGNGVGEWIQNVNFGVGIFSNGAEKMRANATGVGVNTTAPTAYFHVNAASSTTGGIRFENLPAGNTNTYTKSVVADANGNLALLPYGGGVTAGCSTANYIPVWNSTAGQLGCSIIQQNSALANCTTGTHAGIGINGAPIATAVSGSTCNNISLTIYGSAFASGGLWIASDRKFKSNIQDIPAALSIVNKLHGVSYDYKDQEFEQYSLPHGKTLGFIAQELEEIIPEAVTTTSENFKAVNYTALIPVLTEAIKEQQQIIREDESKMSEMREEFAKQVATMQTMIDNICSGGCGNINSSTTAVTTDKTSRDASQLFQNTPNPFSGDTRIDYYIASMNQNAYIMVYDLNGKELKRMPVNTTGKGSVTISGDSLQSGMYIYALIIDGREIDSKKMTLIK